MFRFILQHFTLRNETDRSFLISESVRGEGAVLLDKKMERFTDELQPRDVVTREIRKQMKKDGTDFVWLSMKPIDREQLESHFPNIVKHCREYGYNVPDELHSRSAGTTLFYGWHKGKS